MDILSVLALPIVCGIISNYLFTLLQDGKRGPALVMMAVLSSLALAFTYLPTASALAEGPSAGPIAGTLGGIANQLQSLLGNIPGVPFIGLAPMPAAQAEGMSQMLPGQIAAADPLAALAGAQAYVVGVLFSLATLALMFVTVPREHMPSTLRMVLLVLVAIIVFTRKDLYLGQTMISHQMLLAGCVPALAAVLLAGRFGSLYGRRDWMKLTAFSYFMLLMTTAMTVATL